MIEAEEVSADGLTWTFRLRPGLKFHDGEPVLAKDVVASLNRWAARDQLGQGCAERACHRRRPHLPLGAEEAIFKNAAGAE
jgi:ABC-type transport system substrate-binding protein